MERGLACRAALVLLLCGSASAFIGKDNCKEMSCHWGYNNAPKVAWEGNTKTTRFLGSYDSVSECETACINFKDRKGYTCKSFVWFDEPAKPCLRKTTCYAMQCHAVITDEWAPVEAESVVSGQRGMAASSLFNKAFSTVSNLGQNDSGEAEAAKLSGRQKKTAVAQELRRQKAAAVEEEKKIRAEKAAQAKAEKAAAAAAKKAEKEAVKEARRRAKAGMPEETLLDDLTNPPVAFNIAAIILLIGAVGMVTDSSGSKMASSTPAVASGKPASARMPATMVATASAAGKPAVKKSAPPVRSAPPPKPAVKQEEKEESGGWFAAKKETRKVQRSAPPPAAKQEEEEESGGWFAAKKETRKVQRSAPPPASSPTKTKHEEGVFGIKLPDLGDALAVFDDPHETKLKKLYQERKKANAIDDDGAWLL